ncbi:MAG: glutamine--fructose-6-phosphate transaminase (isomerizing) [Magnetococcales bacterium]|nr:glutamine--fructose-6-phosphate transaminase (isomerizing) [Magnetococcales bacterium]MBF0435595.1 glutamine--fructose-6-phosphate transaminase (isomerizing) [Magnetococcales bacterium]
MCGIIGIIGERNATPVLLEGLRRLEYRGYDSAGVAVGHDGRIDIRRSEGKLLNLENLIKLKPLTGFLGIGHTRWATHGAPTETNAHPHRSERVVVVHNGIIENYRSLRKELSSEGVVFHSDTDTEVIPHLVERELKKGLSPQDAARQAIRFLEGAFALGILIEGVEDRMFAARRGSPLIIGLGEGEHFLASDAQPLVPYTRRMIFLEDDDFVTIGRKEVEITDLSGQPLARPVKHSRVNADTADKWPYRHYMQKEIFEQPSVLGETLKGLIHPYQRTVDVATLVERIDLSQITFLSIVACGTSLHAGMVARYWIEKLAKIPVGVEIASEYRYREPPNLPGSMMVVISQSGETADTIAAMRYGKQVGQKVLGIVNVPESTIARESDGVLYTQAGPEIGVASTKAFTTQLLVLACLAIACGRANGRLSREREKELVEELMQIPALMEHVLVRDRDIQLLAQKLMYAQGFLFLGRGSCYPIALEGALKLKEISYIHAEGYAAGEMKHGPIALIDEELPVVVVAPQDHLFEKVVSNLEEARARGGRLVVITQGHPEEQRHEDRVDDLIPMGPCGEMTAPILYVVPLQLLAYHIAVLKGTDVDQPRNLAKSVTVE